MKFTVRNSVVAKCCSFNVLLNVINFLLVLCIILIAYTD